MAADLHSKSIVIDGLIISDFNRAIFEDMRKGGLTAANCTCCVWEGFTETMRNVMRWKTMLRENSDLITQVYTTEDIKTAKAEGKTGIILGWQNITGIEDQLGYLRCSRSWASASSRWRTIPRIWSAPGVMNQRTPAFPISAMRSWPK